MPNISQLKLEEGMKVLPSITPGKSDTHMITQEHVVLDGEFTQRFFNGLRGLPAISVIEEAMIDAVTSDPSEPQKCVILTINTFLMMLKRSVLPSDMVISESLVKKWKANGVTAIHLYLFTQQQKQVA